MLNYLIFINGNWVDYSWLREGCIDEPHFNWFYSLWTTTDTDIRRLIEEGPYRKFVGLTKEYLKDNKDMESHTKRFALHNVDTKFHIKIGENTLCLL